VENEVRDTFIEALRQILAETDLAVEAFEPGPHPAAEDQVVASVGLTGDVKGILMLSLDARSAFAIARAMTGGVAIPLANEKFTDVHLAAMAELANQVSGRAITMLSGRQMRCDITPPGGHRGPGDTESRAEPRPLVSPHGVRRFRPGVNVPRFPGPRLTPGKTS